MRFGDNSSIKIKGEGTLNIDGKLKAHDVYYVEGLKHNLLSVSQMCDKGYKFTFDSTGCQIKNESIGQNVAKGKRVDGNVYNLKECFKLQCMLGQVDESWFWHSWHRRLGHINFYNLVAVRKKGCVRNIPPIIKPVSTFCYECVKGKKTKVRFRTKQHNTSRPLEIVHTDLCGPARTRALVGERYFMLFIDDYSRMTWVTFLEDKSQEFDRFKIFRKMVKNESGCKMKCLRSNWGREFTSNEFEDYYEIHQIRRQYPAHKTPQQNGMVERNNRTVKEMARTMLNEVSLLDMYWKEAIHTVAYTLN